MTSQTPRILVLGSPEGWHADQLRDASRHHEVDIGFAPYESLAANLAINADASRIVCSAGSVNDFDLVLCRTMPAGNLEQITFRLATLHHLARQARLQNRIVNSPASLEIAIDKFATLSVAQSLGFPIPQTRVVQSRKDAIAAFHELGGDCVVKPIFGGEGRGVMRVQSLDLAQTVFATLDQLGSVIYVQKFIAPGGRDTRLLVTPTRIYGIRRENRSDFRTNNAFDSNCRLAEVDSQLALVARSVCEAIRLDFAAVDLIDDPQSETGYRILEVNAVPGWKSAQTVVPESIARELIESLIPRMKQADNASDRTTGVANSTRMSANANGCD